MPLDKEVRQSLGGSFTIGEWMVEPRLNRLSRAGESIHIEPKMMDVLVCLAEHAGELVERQRLIDAVWATEFISENILTRAVAELRNVLGDDARNPSFIETIHRKGYRLIAPVEADGAATTTVTPFPTPDTSRDERNPYPGLAAFTEDDAEFLLGREAQVARLWRKLSTRQLSAVIGPSGVGKSSFLRAGLIPARPQGWNVLVCQPGEAPLATFGRALVHEFSGELDAIEILVGSVDPDSVFALASRWRDRYEQALLIVDQFEELFTLNSTEVRIDFVTVLGRLIDAAGVHVLVALRDDFLHQCRALVQLRPLFEGLTMLEQPDKTGLHRAVAIPATRLGFSFEDESIVEEMVAEVVRERAALPLLALAISQLWDKRNRDSQLLTRHAYDEIGGVSGVLVRHAEATLRAIGGARTPIVREIFRHLVTTDGTRRACELGSLISGFPAAQRDEAEQILRQLIDARLLTSYEEENMDGNQRHRVEAVHESLSISWPRLVRWRTQDAEAARLRDLFR
jgi:DNA-binding winged helix-turn-helix (wHTH) protein